jgi:molybdopterin-binding protein
MKFGARNQIEATITQVKTGDIMSQVDLHVDGPVAMSSVLTTESLRDLGIVKAIHVLVARD